MFKFLIIFCLIIKTLSWTWDDYPSPRGSDYRKCGVSKPSYVCDPDGLLTDQEREEIVQLVEDFKEKTKRPDSSIPCMRDGLRLVVAIALDEIARGVNSSKDLCSGWMSFYKSICMSGVKGIEFNFDGVRYCYRASWLMPLYEEQYENYMLDGYSGLKSFINRMLNLSIERLSAFDIPDASNETNIKLLQVQQSLQDTKTTLTEMRNQQNRTLSEFIENMEENKKTLSEMHLSLQDTKETLVESLDQQNKTLEETNKKLSEIKQLLSQGQMLVEKNTTKPVEYIGLFSNNL